MSTCYFKSATALHRRKITRFKQRVCTILYLRVRSYSSRFLLDETDQGIATDFDHRDALYRANCSDLHIQEEKRGWTCLVHIFAREYSLRRLPLAFQLPSQSTGQRTSFC